MWEKKRHDGCTFPSPKNVSTLIAVPDFSVPHALKHRVCHHQRYAATLAPAAAGAIQIGVDRLDLGLGSLAIDQDNPASSDPDVWPPPTPIPVTAAAVAAGGREILTSNASPPASSALFSSRRVRRGGEGITGASSGPASSSAADKARERLPVWARAVAPIGDENKRGLSGRAAAAAAGGAVGRREKMVVGGPSSGLRGGQIGLPRRGSRGEQLVLRWLWVCVYVR